MCELQIFWVFYVSWLSKNTESSIKRKISRRKCQSTLSVVLIKIKHKKIRKKKRKTNINHEHVDDAIYFSFNLFCSVHLEQILSKTLHS